MAMLIGKYLVEIVTGKKLVDGRTVYSAEWFINDSPSGSGNDWRELARGSTDQPMDKPENAYAAAKAIGEYQARKRQGNMNLPGKHWSALFPEIPRD